MNRRVFAATLAILLVTAPVGYSYRAASITYTVEDLGTTPDGYVPTVTGMNASGQVSGYVSRPDGLRAVRFTDGLGWQYLPGLSVYSVATAINANGDLTGYYFAPTGLRAFRFVDGVGVTTIPALSGGSFGFGFAISANGDVVGYGNSAQGTRAWRASAGLPPTVPSALAGATSQGCGLNDAGQMVGSYTTPAGPQHAFRVEADGSLTDIGSLDGNSSTACAVDADGLVGGQSSLGSLAHAFLATGATPTDIDAAGSSKSKVQAISNGVSVGLFFLPAGNSHAFVHTAVDGMSDLNSLIPADSGWVLSDATAINAGGRIAGQGLVAGTPRAFRLTPGAAADTTAPSITSLSADPSSITPPNMAMVDVAVSAAATDDQDSNPVCTVSAIDGHGAPPADFSVTGPLAGRVRATGGATYSFTVTCSDAAGNTASNSVDVVVPPDTTAPVMGTVTATPSTVWPPNGALVPVTVSVSATDDSGAEPSCALSAITSSGVTADDFTITGAFDAKVRAVGGRTYSLVVTCADAAGNHSDASADVVVPPDTTAPVISSLTASPDSVWPPNGKMVAVSLSVSATDDVDAAPQCSLTSITSNGGGPTDARITGLLTASVRAEKNGDGTTRVYSLQVTCSDSAGNQSVGTTGVAVSKDPSAAKAAFRALLTRLADRLLDTKEHDRTRSGRD